MLSTYECLIEPHLRFGSISALKRFKKKNRRLTLDILYDILRTRDVNKLRLIAVV